jgi:hypothetical protein
VCVSRGRVRDGGKRGKESEESERREMTINTTCNNKIQLIFLVWKREKSGWLGIRT